MSCGSGNVESKKSAPECNSMRLRKEALIEHFSCAPSNAKQSLKPPKATFFPKCKTKLKLTGSDYRILPPAYVCLGCNKRISEPLLVMKCDDCASTGQLDEEPELYLYKYTPRLEIPTATANKSNPSRYPKLFQIFSVLFVISAFRERYSSNQNMQG